jgi:hypothetical protein
MITMPKRAKTPDAPSGAVSVRVLRPEEYPPEITARRGMYTPEVLFAAVHPAGLYHVEHEGGGSYGAYFTPKRRGSRMKRIGSGGSLRGALARVSRHEDDLLHPDAPRETGQDRPVSIFALGERTAAAGPKPRSRLDEEIEAVLREARGAEPGR